MDLKQIRCVDIRSEDSGDQGSRTEIEMLADSIRSHGLLRPVLVRSTDDGYVIVHGKRRWRAARMLGLEVIPAYLVEHPVQEVHAA
jgi:ParB family chromosome partitioning protein